MTPYVAPRTHNKRMVSNLPDAIRNTKKIRIKANLPAELRQIFPAELRQIFPLFENTLRHIVEGNGRYPRAMNLSALALIDTYAEPHTKKHILNYPKNENPQYINWN